MHHTAGEDQRSSVIDKTDSLLADYDMRASAGKKSRKQSPEKVATDAGEYLKHVLIL